MKRICIILVLCFSLAQAGEIFGFGVGEKIVFDVNANGVKVGTQVMEVVGLEYVNDRLCYHCRADTQILPEIAQRFNYYLHDVFHAWMDVETGLPVRVVKEIHEGSWRNYITYDFYHGIRKIWYVNQKHEPDGRYISFETSVLDILSLIYYLRWMEFEPDSYYEFEYIGGETADMVTLWIGEGSPISDETGTISIQQVSEDTPYRISLTLTDDERRIPIYASLVLDVKGFMKLNIDGGIVSYTPPDEE